MFLCIFQIYKEHAAITVRWYSFQYTLDSLLWLLLGNGITEDLYFLMSFFFFFSFIHLNCPLVVKKKKTTLCVQHIILVLFLDTPDDYIPHLPYHWPEVIGLGSGQWKWGKVMRTLAGPPINPCRIYHSPTLLPGQVWGFKAGTVTRWASLGPWEPFCHIEVMMKTDQSPAVRNHWDAGIVTAVHLSYYPKN